MACDIYIVRYQDNMYPEDNEMIGAYTTLTEAKNIINQRVESYKDPKFPGLNLSDPSYYKIDCLLVEGIIKE